MGGLGKYVTCHIFEFLFFLSPVRFSDPDFLKKSNNLAIRLRFQGVFFSQNTKIDHNSISGLSYLMTLNTCQMLRSKLG